jgi:hypothetical protein
MTKGTRPTFLIPGVSRAGTTTLHDFLSEHPDIFMPADKELRFFDRAENYQRGLDFYESQFSGAQNEAAVGEASPPYWYQGISFDPDREFVFDTDDDPPTRIHEAYPDLKIVFTLRNPVTRAYSQYWKNVRQGRERVYPFSDAIRAEIDGDRDHRETPMCWYYKNQYSVHLQRWVELFGRDQILPLVFENWIQEPEAALNRICEFLGVAPQRNWPHASRQKNKTKTPRNLRINELYHDYLKYTGIGELLYYLNLRSGYPPMDDSMRSYLREVFEPEYDAIESLLDIDLDVWRAEF